MKAAVRAGRIRLLRQGVLGAGALRKTGWRLCLYAGFGFEFARLRF